MRAVICWLVLSVAALGQSGTVTRLVSQHPTISDDRKCLYWTDYGALYCLSDAGRFYTFDGQSYFAMTDDGVLLGVSVSIGKSESVIFEFKNGIH